MSDDRTASLQRVNRAAGALGLPPAIWKTCPWQPRAEIETGLRQWLRCAGAALLDDQVIGMPSHAVDEAWHGLILCTGRYARFCDDAYGRFLHHHPEGDVVPGEEPAVPVGRKSLLRRRPASAAGSMDEQLARTVAAWSMVAEPGEACVLWDLDTRLGLDHPWGLDPAFVADLQRALPPAHH